MIFVIVEVVILPKGIERKKQREAQTVTAIEIQTMAERGIRREGGTIQMKQNASNQADIKIRPRCHFIFFEMQQFFDFQSVRHRTHRNVLPLVRKKTDEFVLQDFFSQNVKYFCRYGLSSSYERILPVVKILVNLRIVK